MTERLLKSLYDIKGAIDEIDSYFSSREKRFDVYKAEILLRRGIERNLEVIGEAMGRILKENESIKITDARRIIGLRNQLIHGYDTISDENIWAVVINHLPLLKSEIAHLIDGNV
ncbi:MAG: hypothetical protein ACI9FU_001890 [Granulosicoccus sp.]|jgi:uncharacterized protein with HEPN domain